MYLPKINDDGAALIELMFVLAECADGKRGMSQRETSWAADAATRAVKHYWKNHDNQAGCSEADRAAR